MTVFNAARVLAFFCNAVSGLVIYYATATVLQTLIGHDVTVMVSGITAVGFQHIKNTTVASVYTILSKDNRLPMLATLLAFILCSFSIFAGFNAARFMPQSAIADSLFGVTVTFEALYLVCMGLMYNNQKHA